MSAQPHVVLIMSDQHSPHVLGCAGDPVARTPRLDHLAEQGVRFTSTYCPNPLCVPSRMSFLASRHCKDIGVWTNGCQLRSDLATFVHHLVNAGYETVLCGRMHFVGTDQRHGFERRIIGDVHMKLEHIPVVTTGQTAPGVRVAGPGRTAYSRYDEEVTKVCREFLQARDREPGDRPLFLCVGYVLPHCPYICPKALFEEYMDQIQVPRLPQGYLDTLHPAMRLWREHREVDTITPEEARRARAAYYGLVTYTDQLVGDIFETLAETHFGRDTVVVYTSDHGDMAGEHGMWWKSSFYEGSVGVPMIWSWPGQFAEGRAVPSATSLVDIGPTLVDLAGAEPMPLAGGQSLRGFLEGDGRVPDWPDAAFSEFVGLPQDGTGRMVRRGPWKLNHYHGYDRPQLFHLEADPGEWKDLGADPEREAVREELQGLVLTDWSGEEVQRALARHEADRRVLMEWRKRAQLSVGDPPDRWTAPDGCNTFPEE